MNEVQFIKSGIAASALAHLAVLATVLILAEVHPFGPLTSDPVKVEIVTPEEIQAAKDAPPAPSPEIPLPDPSAKPEASGGPAAPPPPQPQQTSPVSQAQQAPQEPRASKSSPAPASRPDPQPVAAQRAQQQQPPRQTSPAPPIPAPIPQAPDLSVKYHVVLGLPQGRPGDGFDAPASEKAGLAPSLIKAFKRHFRTCWKLPESIAPTDNVRIKMRVLMTPDGALAANPVPIEGSASEKGPALMQSAIDAMQACQPYTMLPADQYREWKILDIPIAPQDFTDG